MFWKLGTAGKGPSVMGEKMRVRDLSSKGCAGFPRIMEDLDDYSGNPSLVPACPLTPEIRRNFQRKNNPELCQHPSPCIKVSGKPHAPIGIRTHSIMVSEPRAPRKTVLLLP